MSLPAYDPPPRVSALHRRRLGLSRFHWRVRAKRSLRDLTSVSVKPAGIAAAPILAFATVRNEAKRLPYFLAHYRRLGVRHFLIVSNDSTDGTDALLQAEPDVSLWTTKASYKDARFGMNWINGLLGVFGTGKWTVSVDADELLVYPEHEAQDLHALTGWLDAQGHRSFGAMLLDLYPKGSPDVQTYAPGQDPLEVLPWFDAVGYWARRQSRHQALCVRGGPRARVFFPDAPAAAPVLSKAPLVRWDRSYAYISSTHVLLPPELNEHGAPGRPTGALLHSKFLPGVAAQAREDAARGQQYTNGSLHVAYYKALSEAPDLWTDQSHRYTGAAQLEALGLITRGRWFDKV